MELNDRVASYYCSSMFMSESAHNFERYEFTASNDGIGMQNEANSEMRRLAGARLGDRETKHEPANL